MASRGSETSGSPKRLKDVLKRTGAGARSPNLCRSRQKRGGASDWSLAREAMKLQLAEQSKRKGTTSAGAENAKGWKSSRCLMYWLTFSMTYSEKGEARMLRFPSARCPNSVRP